MRLIWARGSSKGDELTGVSNRVSVSVCQCQCQHRGHRPGPSMPSIPYLELYSRSSAKSAEIRARVVTANR
jgi:hypothetical protein